MKDGFIKVAAATPKITVADVSANGVEIRRLMKEADEKKVKLLVLPELCITGYTCGELFLQGTLLNRAKEELFALTRESKAYNMITVVGVPLQIKGRLFNCAAFLYHGEILGIVPKTYLPSYSEFYEGRHFVSSKVLDGADYIHLEGYEGEEDWIPFSMELRETKLTRQFANTPFVPGNPKERKLRCEEILNIQAMGLKKRLSHTHCQSAVIGISGGLDSTLALLVTVIALDKLGMDRNQITCITMPCFGTTDRTYSNACALVKALGVNLMEINIEAAVNQHFQDIGQDASSALWLKEMDEIGEDLLCKR